MVYTKISKIYGIIINNEDLPRIFPEIVQALKDDLNLYKEEGGEDYSITDDLRYEIRQQLNNVMPTVFNPYPLRFLDFPCCSQSSEDCCVLGVLVNDDVRESILNKPFTATSLRVVPAEVKQAFANVIQSYPTLADKKPESILMLDDCLYCS